MQYTSHYKNGLQLRFCLTKQDFKIYLVLSNVDCDSVNVIIVILTAFNMQPECQCTYVIIMNYYSHGLC